MRVKPSSIALVALIVLAVAVLVGLGVWQLQRNQWKQDLVAQYDARTEAPPLTIRDATGLDPEELDYRHVTLEGQYPAGEVMLLANRIRAATRGQELIVPLQPADGGPLVLVNYGWVPDGWWDSTAIQWPTTPIEGLARSIEGRDARQTDAGTWTGVSAEAMGAALGQPVAEWYVVAGTEREPEAGTGGQAPPIQGWVRFVNTTPHVEYALTWFGLAAALVAVALGRFVIAPRRARRGAPPG